MKTPIRTTPPQSTQKCPLGRWLVATGDEPARSQYHKVRRKPLEARRRAYKPAISIKLVSSRFRLPCVLARPEWLLDRLMYRVSTGDCSHAQAALLLETAKADIGALVDLRKIDAAFLRIWHGALNHAFPHCTPRLHRRPHVEVKPDPLWRPGPAAPCRTYTPEPRYSTEQYNDDVGCEAEELQQAA